MININLIHVSAPGCNLQINGVQSQHIILGMPRPYWNDWN